MRLNRSSILLFRLLLLCLAVSGLHGAVLVTLSTSSNSLTAGGSATLTALVTGAGTNNGVTWSLSGPGSLGAGNAPSGSGQSLNNYLAPSPISTRQTVTITATSISDTTKSASVQIQINPASITVSPATVTLAANGAQQFSATGGSGNYAWSISPQSGSIDQTGLYTAPGAITSVGTVTVTATSVEDSTTFGTAKITLTANATVSVSISPTSASLAPGQGQLFSATVNNAANSAVIWSISPQTGSIDQTGFYTAPATITVSTKITVTATAAADSSKSASATVTVAPVTDVGTGAPTATMQQQFLTAFFRNGFNLLVTLPPAGAVKRLGTTGYVQEFNGVVSGTKLALATVSPTAPPSSDGTTGGVVQLEADLYAYYTTVGASTAGLPLYDTLACPPIDQTNSCTYDIFDKSYALFAYHAALANGQNFTIRNLSGSTSVLFYTEWTNRGGITGMGRPVDVETTVTATVVPPATTGTTDDHAAYINGAIYSITSGLNKNVLFSVLQPIYGLYVTNGGPTGSLGLPTTQEIVLSNGDHRQTFEGGVLQYTPGSDPVLRPPVSTVVISGAVVGATLNLTLGQTVTLTAAPTSPAGIALTDRPVSWSTTNSRVITITATNATAVLKAVGGGAASVTAASEGVASQKINVIVIAPCCQVGDGAPPAVQQSFKDALTRNKISVQPPVPSPATRVGNGYIQMVQSTDAQPVTYLVAESDSIGTAYVVGGAVLAAWQALGGAGGHARVSDERPERGRYAAFRERRGAGREPGAPGERRHPDQVGAAWATRPARPGAPVSDAVAFSTFGANSGMAQGFANGAIYAATGGSAQRAGVLRHRADSGALQRAGRRRAETTACRSATSSSPAACTSRISKAATSPSRPATPRRRSIRRPRRPGLIVSPGSVSAGGHGAAGHRRLPHQQHDQGVDHRPARFHRDHRQRRLQLGHVLPAEFARAGA